MKNNKNTEEDESARISKAIFDELDVQLEFTKENLRRKEQKEEEFNKNLNFHLFVIVNKKIEPSQDELNEIEKLAMNLRPCHYNSFVNDFRLAVDGETDVTAVVRTLEIMLKEYLTAHPVREPGNRLLRLVRNLSNVNLISYFRKRSSKVIPVDHGTAEQEKTVSRRLSSLFITTKCCRGKREYDDDIDSDFEDGDDYESLNPNDLNILALVPTETEYDYYSDS